MSEDNNIIKCWMPITKSADGKFYGILSDTSLDRDNEFMTEELIDSWSKLKNIKALVNHENKMEKWVGGWSCFQKIKKGDNFALIAEPWFFSKDANPLAQQVKKQVEEALERGEPAGISIGAMPLESIEKEINGKKHKGYKRAELLEGTWVPIQSNRNANSFGSVAKSFDFEFFEEQNEVKKEIKMEEVQENIVQDSEPIEQVEKLDKSVQLESELNKATSELVNANARIALLEKEINDMKNKAVLKATVETNKEVPMIAKNPTMENMFAARFQS